MYFPYLRGRQYELLALRELAKQKLQGNNILPIIEPVKNTSTLQASLDEYKKAGLPIALIFNPMVGDLVGKQELIKPLCELLGGVIVPAIIIRNNVIETIELLRSYGATLPKVLAILPDRDALSIYERAFSSAPPQYTLFPDERVLRHRIKQGKVMLDDKFNKQPKNADYPEDEFYSDEHLYFKEEGYDGFGDYSIIGMDYSETGFAPHAVAIHIVYLDNEGALRIRHFISDSNEDISDTSGKFYEAIEKLANWYYAGQERQRTMGLSLLLQHYENKTYPGLPTLKKLSIMHHLELIGRQLGNGAQS